MSSTQDDQTGEAPGVAVIRDSKLKYRRVACPPRDFGWQASGTFLGRVQVSQYDLD